MSRLKSSDCWAVSEGRAVEQANMIVQTMPASRAVACHRELGNPVEQPMGAVSGRGYPRRRTEGNKPLDRGPIGRSAGKTSSLREPLKNSTQTSRRPEDSGWGRPVYRSLIRRDRPLSRECLAASVRAAWVPRDQSADWAAEEEEECPPDILSTPSEHREDPRAPSR